jgi:hypothetical protein
MPFYIVSILLPLIAIVHLVRTGRDMRWIFLIVFLPVVGALAYFAVEVLPSLRQSPGALRALQRARATIDPNRGLREGELEYERSQNVATASRLADELTKAGRFDEAIRVCGEARQGVFEDDPKILLALAGAQFGAARYTDVIATLDCLRAKHPTLRISDGHLLYARALEESGATQRALEEYAALARYYPGAEARVRQALLYKKLGERDNATELLAAILKDARLAPRHFRRSQAEWIAVAERENAAIK